MQAPGGAPQFTRKGRGWAGGGVAFGATPTKRGARNLRPAQETRTAFRRPSRRARNLRPAQETRTALQDGRSADRRPLPPPTPPPTTYRTAARFPAPAQEEP